MFPFAAGEIDSFELVVIWCGAAILNGRNAIVLGFLLLSQAQIADQAKHAAKPEMVEEQQVQHELAEM
jgi:hypothetical protein